MKKAEEMTTAKKVNEVIRHTRTRILAEVGKLLDDMEMEIAFELQEADPPAKMKKAAGDDVDKRSKYEKNPFKKETDGIAVASVVRKHLQIINSKLENPLSDPLDINGRYEHFLKNEKFYKTASNLANKINGRDGGLLLLPNSWLGGCIASVCHIGTDKEFDNAETFFRKAIDGGSDFLAVNDLHKELINDWSVKKEGKKGKNRKRPNCCDPELDTLKKIFKAWAIFKAGKKATPLDPKNLDGVTLP